MDIQPSGEVMFALPIISIAGLKTFSSLKQSTERNEF